MKKNKILRQLDSKETNLLKRGFEDNVLYELKLKSKLDLLSKENIETLKKTVLVWKRTQKFLSSRIIKRGEREYYFEYIDDNDESYKFDNIRFVRVKSPNEALNEKQIDTLCDLLNECIFTDIIDPDIDSDRLLWHIHFVELKIDHLHESSSYSYVIYFEFHHSITQGTATFISICTFFTIFEKLKQGETIELEVNPVFPGCESLFSFSKDFKDHKPVPRIKRPSFIDPDRAKKSSLSESTPIMDFSIQLIDVESGHVFKSIKELVEISRNNHMKHMHHELSQEIFEKVLKRCHEEGVKLTGFFQAIFTLVIREMYRKYGQSNELEQIVYYTVLTLRSFVKEQGIDESTLGLCTGGLFSTPNMNEINMMLKNETNLKTMFWSLARKASHELHERLKSDMGKFFPKFHTIEQTDLFYHFNVSSTGKIDYVSDVVKFDFLEIEDVYANINISPNFFKRLFALFLHRSASGGYKLTISYNSHFIDRFIIQNAVFDFSSLLEKILSETKSSLKSKI